MQIANFCRQMFKPFLAFSQKRGFSTGSIVPAVLFSLVVTLQAARAQQATPVILDAMTQELQRAYSQLGKQATGNAAADKQLPPYFLSYAVSDANDVIIRAQYG